MQRSTQKETRRGATHDGLREQCRKHYQYNGKPLNQQKVRLVARGGGMRR